MHKSLTILGATGSIGTTCLNLLRRKELSLCVDGLSANTSVAAMADLVREFRPQFVHMMDETAALRLRELLPGQKVHWGMNSLLDWLCTSRLVLAAMVGNVGLLPVLTALEHDSVVALANKETLVSAGHLVQKTLLARPGAALLPVDSEHSAIHQCLRGENRQSIEKIHLTASGGSFREKSLRDMESVSVSDALKHPNWDMGAKITIDSSTLMNKGLEVIEAHWLFEVDYDHIEVVIHPQSIIHSMVSFHDGSVMAQLGVPDMTLPVAYALGLGNARQQLSSVKRLDFMSLSRLDFSTPDSERFPNLALAYSAGRLGGSAPCALNAANEASVQAFIDQKVSFLDISRLNAATLKAHQPIANPDLQDILEVDRWAREYVQTCVARQSEAKA